MSQKTILELSRELKITPQAIYKKINKQLDIQFKEYMHTGIKGQTLIDERGQAILQNSFKPVQQPNSVGSTTGSTTNLNGLNQFKVHESIEDMHFNKENIENSFKPVQQPNSVGSTTGSTSLNNQIVSNLNNQIEFLLVQNKNLERELNKEREHSHEQSNKILSLAEQILEITRNNQVLLKQEQDRNNITTDNEISKLSKLSKLNQEQTMLQINQDDTQKPKIAKKKSFLNWLKNKD